MDIFFRKASCHRHKPDFLVDNTIKTSHDIVHDNSGKEHVTIVTPAVLFRNPKCVVLGRFAQHDRV